MPSHEHEHEILVALEFKRIADELHEIKHELKCICKALQPPKAQSAKLVITSKET